MAKEEHETADWRRTELFTGEDVESAVRRAAQAVYGSDERLDHLLKETRRFLAQGRRRPNHALQSNQHPRERGTEWD